MTACPSKGGHEGNHAMWRYIMKMIGACVLALTVASTSLAIAQVGWYWNGHSWECRNCYRGDMPIYRPSPPPPSYYEDQRRGSRYPPNLDDEYQRYKSCIEQGYRRC